MNHLNIYQLRDEIEQLVNAIVDAEIEGDTEKLKTLHAELEALHEVRSAKHESYVHVIKNAENTAVGCKVEADLFTKRASALKNLAKRLKETLLDDLIEYGEQSTTTEKFKIARQNNAQPTLHIRVDAEELPDTYQILVVEADKDALKTALAAGVKVEGVALEVGEHVRIRAK